MVEIVSLFGADSTNSTYNKRMKNKSGMLSRLARFKGQGTNVKSLQEKVLKKFQIDAKDKLTEEKLGRHKSCMKPNPEISHSENDMPYIFWSKCFFEGPKYLQKVQNNKNIYQPSGVEGVTRIADNVRNMCNHFPEDKVTIAKLI